MLNINEEQKKLLEENAVAVATVDEAGKPHCIAVAAAKVVSDNQILITDNYMQRTPKNIGRNASIAVAVWNKNWEDNCTGYEFLGTARYFSTGEWHDKVKSLEENKGMPAKGALLVTIDRIKRLA